MKTGLWEETCHLVGGGMTARKYDGEETATMIKWSVQPVVGDSAER